MYIRKANQADIAELAQVQVDSYRQAYAGILPQVYLEHFTYEEQEGDWREFFAVHPRPLLYVAVDEMEKVVGYALARQNPNTVQSYHCELDALHVRQECRRQGVGRQLMAAVSQALVSQGFNTLFLWVLEDNPACLFYEKLGGVRVAKKPWQNNAYFGTSVNEVAYGWADLGSLLGDKSRV